MHQRAGAVNCHGTGGIGEPMDPKHIITILDKVAQERGVSIIFACESGSRAWGFESPDSDYDVRFLYVRPVADYLRLSPPDDTIEVSPADDLDVSGWDVFKACRLMRKSNPPLLEWLGSPTVYREDAAVEGLRSIGRQHFSRRACAEHYLSMANMNHSKCTGRVRVVRKKYLYVLRPLACARWLVERETFPPTAFDDVLAGVAGPDDVRQEIARLLADKKVNREMGEMAALPVFQDFIEGEVGRLTAAIRTIPGTHFPEAPLDGWLAGVLDIP